jgi:hypothetical protein
MPSTESIVWLAIVTVVGFVVWLAQKRLNSKEAARLKDIADRERERAEREKEAREKIAEGHKALLDRVGALEKQNTEDTQTLALLKQEMLPMAEAMKRKLVELLTHPSEEFASTDVLLAEIKKAGAPMPDGLEPFLKERIQSKSPHVTEQEKLAAEALPIITRLAELEAREPHLTITGVQLVSSTAKSPETKKGEEAS